MASMHVCLIALALTASLTHASSVDYKAAVAANPIRKVVNMLQAMQTKITAEGEKEKDSPAACPASIDLINQVVNEYKASTNS